MNDEIRRPNERGIRVTQVRLIGADSEQLGIVTLDVAIQTARDASLDLVEISPNSEPPVCRVMDFNKFKYQEKKRKQEHKKKQKLSQSKVKELKLRPVTEQGDYEVKVRNAKRFLTEGDKVKITIRFRGRELQYQQLGMEMASRVEKDLEEEGMIEQRAKLEGRQIVMILAPKKK